MKLKIDYLERLFLNKKSYLNISRSREFLNMIFYTKKCFYKERISSKQTQIPQHRNINVSICSFYWACFPARSYPSSISPQMFQSNVFFPCLRSLYNWFSLSFEQIELLEIISVPICSPSCWQSMNTELL